MQGNVQTLTPLVRQIIDDASAKSVLGSVEKQHEGLDPKSATVTAPTPLPRVVFAAGGVSSGFVFTSMPDAFIPQLVGGYTSSRDESAPDSPRLAAARMLVGEDATEMSTVQNVLSWAPPLVDTDGRWLESLANDPGVGPTYSDSIMYYLIQRTNLGTGEVATIAMVSHSKQSVAPIRTFLEEEHAAGRPGVITDPATHRAVFDSALYKEILDPSGKPILDADSKPLLEVVVPANAKGEKQDIFFTFNDTTAVYGQPYAYIITAITSDQHEGRSVTVYPGQGKVEGALDVTFSPAWCATMPALGPGQTRSETSYLDLTLKTGAAIAEVEVVLVPVLDNAIHLDDFKPDLTRPTILETDKIIKLTKPSEGVVAGEIVFIGRNIQSSGGIRYVKFGTGIVLSGAKDAITFERVGTESDPTTSQDFKYKVLVTIDNTAPIGTRTMTITCADGRTASTSNIEVTDVGDISALIELNIDEGAQFMPATCLATGVEVSIRGKNLQNIESGIYYDYYRKQFPVSFSKRYPTAMTVTFEKQEGTGYIEFKPKAGNTTNRLHLIYPVFIFTPETIHGTTGDTAPASSYFASNPSANSTPTVHFL